MQGASRDTRISLEYFDISNLSDGQLIAELAGLQFQYKFFQRELQGRLLPPQAEIQEIESVLDIMCNMGDWCIDFHQHYPGKRIHAIDMDKRILQFTREHLDKAGINDIHLSEVKSLPMLQFPDASFDLIHVLNGAQRFSIAQWPTIMAELVRLLRPGGWLYLVDIEMGPVSTPVVDRYITIIAQILARINRSISPNGSMPFTGCTFGPRRMAEAGLSQISYTLNPVNFGGWNNPMGRTYLNSRVLHPEIIVPMAVRTGVSTYEELQPLVNELWREVQQIGFCAVAMLLSAYGRKPLKHQ